MNRAATTTGLDVACAGLVVAFGQTVVLDGIDLRIGAGEQVALLGPSGAGKSTLLRVLLGAVQPEAGTVRIGGLDPFDRRQARAVRRAAGLVRQRDDLVLGLTARTNILIGVSHRWHTADWLAVLRGRVPAGYQQPLHELSHRHGVADLLDAKVENLSGGQRQRVALLRALLGSPALLLADEATSGLDPARADEALQHLRSSTATLIVTTHDLRVARRFSRIIALRDGQVVIDAADLTEADVTDIYGEAAVAQREVTA